MLLLYLIFPPTLLKMFMPQNQLIYCNHVPWEDFGGCFMHLRCFLLPNCCHVEPLGEP